MPKTEVMHTINRYVLILVALTALAAMPTARAQDALAKQARAILKEHCFVCHGEDGAAEGGLNFILAAWCPAGSLSRKTRSSRSCTGRSRAATSQGT